MKLLFLEIVKNTWIKSKIFERRSKKIIKFKGNKTDGLKEVVKCEKFKSIYLHQKNERQFFEM